MWWFNCILQCLVGFHLRNMDQLSVGRHWRLARVYGGRARRNAIDSTGDALVESPCATVTDTDYATDKF